MRRVKGREEEGRGGEGRGEECVGVCGDIGRKDCMMGIFKEE